MRVSTRSVLLGVVLGIGPGFLLSHALGRGGVANGGARRPPHPGLATDLPAAGVMDVEQWLARFEAIDWNRPDGARLGELQQALGSNSALRNRVLSLYRETSDLQRRGVLRRMLTADASPEVGGYALKMAAGTDVRDRAAGFELLAGLPPTGESTALVKRALESERDAAALAAVLLALQPRVPPSPAEIADMVPRFLKLVRHESALVRAHSIQLVAEWDRGGKTAEPVIAEALSDPAPLVRQAAVGAIMVGQIRSDRLKSGLLHTVGNSAEELQTRFGAQHALERFDLSAEEHKAYLLARNDVEKATSAATAPPN